MPSLQRKVVPVADTQKITQAMKMGSSTKLKRVQDRIFFRPVIMRINCESSWES
jgi:F0F1-type ATP synthase gamma subunit